MWQRLCKQCGNFGDKVSLSLLSHNEKVGFLLGDRRFSFVHTERAGTNMYEKRKRCKFKDSYRAKLQA